MAFNHSQINDGRLAEIYKGVLEDGRVRGSLVDDLATTLERGQIGAYAGTMKTLDLDSQVATSDDQGFVALGAPSQTRDAKVSGRSYEIKKIAFDEVYARGLEGDLLFGKLEQTIIPRLHNRIQAAKDKELNVVLSGNGTSSGNAQDTTVRQLSAGANETWDKAQSDPLDDLLQAAQDTLADTIVLGMNRVNLLRSHAQFQSQTGMKHITLGDLADFLKGYTGVSRVFLANHFFSNAALGGTASPAYIGADSAAVFHSSNLVYLSWEGIVFEEEPVLKNNQNVVYGRAHGAIIVPDKNMFVTFQNVA